ATTLAPKMKVILVTQPFVMKNKRVLLPTNVRGYHWCGAVFDFESSITMILDPLQQPKQIEECKNTIKVLFPEKIEKIIVKHEECLKQT
ncbi:hypothetical protein F443_18235, partial [Phytophthora nicotianae P1569]